jgi:hypothetical protein
MAKSFEPKEFEDFKIMDEGKVVGAIRIKPSGIAWAPKGSHRWHRVSLEAFGEFALKHGTEQKK